MKITITMKLLQSNESYDIQVSDSQKIIDTLRILKDNLPMFRFIEEVEHVKEKDSGRIISTEFTYAQMHLYSGNELLIK